MPPAYGSHVGEREATVNVPISNAEVMARRNKAVVRGIAHATSIIAARAQNAELWDVEGKRYIDFAGGIAVQNVGHCHPRVVAAAKTQIDRFIHTASQVALYEPYVRLAERLSEIVPIQAPVKVALFTTGSEATENAVKIARAASGRPGVIAFAGAFHGRTIASLGLTGKVVPYKKNLGPVQPEIWHAPFPMEHYGFTVTDSLKWLEVLFRADVDPSRIAAIIVEPVQGEGGFHVAPPELMRALRRICDENGIVLIADEIQTGIGRTGRMFAMEHYDTRPDLICIGKSLAGGFPLSAVVGRSAIMDAIEPGGLGGTFGGNPVSCAAALAVLDVIQEEDLLARGMAIGAMIRERLKEIEMLPDRLPIAAVRGLGPMVAFDVVRTRGAHEPDAAAAKAVVQEACRSGLVILSCGIHGNSIRILVPLTAESHLIREGMNVLDAALRAPGDC